LIEGALMFAIVTAGLARRPGMSRNDLLTINAEITTDVAQNIKRYCPEAFVIVVTNPLDAMVWVMREACGLPHHRVVGMAGVLDSGRFRCFLSEALAFHLQIYKTFVLGGHGMPWYRCLGIRVLPEFPCRT